MNRRVFEKHLRSHGCRFHRRGARHDIWINPANGKKAPLPRHKTVTSGVVRAVCKSLDVSHPVTS